MPERFRKFFRIGPARRGQGRFIRIRPQAPAGQKVSDLWVAGAALFISLATMAVYIFQAHIMREQQKMAAWPHVIVGVGNVPHFEVTIKNAGLGPAVIHEVKFIYDGSTLDGYGPFLNKITNAEHPMDAYGMTLASGSVIMAGETKVVAVVENQAVRSEMLKRFWDKQCDVRVAYSSVYGDCWISDINGVKKTKPWKGDSLF